MRRLIIPLMAAGLFLFPSADRAARTAGAAVLPMDIPELVAGSSVCVRGDVIDAQAAWSGGQAMIYTTYTIQCRETLMGSCPPQISVRVPGGDLSGVRIRNGEAPVFALGEEVVVFVNPEPEDAGAYRTYGWFQGKLTILNGMVRERLNESYDALRGDILAAAALKK